MAIDNPFSLDQAADTSTDSQRVRKLKSLGPNLSSLAVPEADLSQEPLNSGSISKNASISPEIGEPSEIATERVQRAPVLQEQSPLLGASERLGNLDTGEEGTYNTGKYGPLSGEQRSLSLRDFFGSGVADAETPSTESENSGNMGAQSRDVGGAGTANALNYTKMGVGLAQNTLKGGGLDQRINKGLNSLFHPSAPSIDPKGFSLYGQGSNPGEFPIDPSGFSLSGQGSAPGDFPIDPSGLDLSGAEGLGGAGGAFNYLGAGAAGAGTALSLASLINSIVNNQATEGQYAQTGMGLATSLVPILASLGVLPAAASGIGLAATPMLIPAIKSIIDMFHEPSPPENAISMKDYQSLQQGRVMAPKIEDYIRQNSDNPNALLGLTTSPFMNDQVVFNSDSLGPARGEGYEQGLYNLATNPNEQSIRDFISGSKFYSGATGHPDYNAQLTDTFRRTLAHSLGMSPEQAAGLFEDPSGGSFYDRQLGMIQGFQGSNTPPSLENMQDLSSKLPTYADESYSDYNGYSPYYRDPAAGRLTGDQATSLQALLESVMGSLHPSQEQTMNDPYLQSLQAAGMGRG